jgi:four helix bundle protein
MGFAFEDLQVYQRALGFSVSVIDCVDEMDLPRKHYRLIEQLESSCTSIPLNIAEGKGRFSKKEFRHFLYIARGSLYETITMLQIFLRKEWLEQLRYGGLYSEAGEINRMLSGLISSPDK